MNGAPRISTSAPSNEVTLPLVIGHMIVGRVETAGEGARRFAPGQRIGVPWLGYVDETCRFCRRGLENLCVNARFTGYQVDGGYAEFVVADSRFCFRIPAGFPDLQAAPLLCAGLIGYRSLRLAACRAVHDRTRVRRVRRRHLQFWLFQPQYIIELD